MKIDPAPSRDEFTPVKISLVNDDQIIGTTAAGEILKFTCECDIPICVAFRKKVTLDQPGRWVEYLQTRHPGITTHVYLELGEEEEPDED